MQKILQRFRNQEDGVTVIEYALIAALIATVIILSVRAAGTATSTTFSSVSNELNTANH